jgi:hypothetical protein
MVLSPKSVRMFDRKNSENQGIKPEEIPYLSNPTRTHKHEIPK